MSNLGISILQGALLSVKWIARCCHSSAARCTSARLMSGCLCRAAAPTHGAWRHYPLYVDGDGGDGGSGACRGGGGEGSGSGEQSDDGSDGTWQQGDGGSRQHAGSWQRTDSGGRGSGSLTVATTDGGGCCSGSGWCVRACALCRCVSGGAYANGEPGGYPAVRAAAPYPPIAYPIYNFLRNRT